MGWSEERFQEKVGEGRASSADRGRPPLYGATTKMLDATAYHGHRTTTLLFGYWREASNNIVDTMRSVDCPRVQIAATEGPLGF